MGGNKYGGKHVDPSLLPGDPDFETPVRDYEPEPEDPGPIDPDDRDQGDPPEQATESEDVPDLTKG